MLILRQYGEFFFFFRNDVDILKARCYEKDIAWVNIGVENIDIFIFDDYV